MNHLTRTKLETLADQCLTYKSALDVIDESNTNDETYLYLAKLKSRKTGEFFCDLTLDELCLYILFAAEMLGD